MPSPDPMMWRRKTSPAGSARCGREHRSSCPITPLDAAIIYAPAGQLVPAGAARGAQGRQGRVRGHPHERHSGLSLRPALGGTATGVGRQPHAPGRAGFPARSSRRPESGPRRRRSRSARPTRCWNSCGADKFSALRSSHPRVARHDRFDQQPTHEMQDRRVRLSGRPGTASACSSDRYPCSVGVSRRRPRAEDQARRPFSLSRLFDAGEAKGRLRRGDPDKPSIRAADLSSRRSDHARRRRIACDRRRGCAGRIRDRDDPFRRAPDHRSSGRSRSTGSRSRRRHCRRDRGLARRCAAAPREPWIESIPPIIADNTAAFRAAGLLSGRATSIDLDAGVACRHFPRSARCSSSAASRDLCGDAMAICIWRTSC